MHPALWRAAFTAGALVAVPAGAVELRYKGIEVQFDNLYSLGAAVRAESRDPALIGLANGGSAYSTNADDGNLAFDRGDVVSSATKLTSTLALSYKDYGFFLRGSGAYDPTLNEQTLFDTSDYGIGREFGLQELHFKEREVRDSAARNLGLLDAYVFGAVPLGKDRQLSVRVGRQPLDWGESLLLMNGLSSVLAVDLNRMRAPAFVVEEVIRPTGMAWGSLALSRNFGLEGFYQYEWRPTVLDASGTFWSVNDFAGPGGTQYNLGYGRVDENIPAGTVSVPTAPGAACLPLPPLLPILDCVPLGSTIPRLSDRTPSRGGQYGGAVHFTVPSLNDLEVGVYAAKYHSRLPLFAAVLRATAALLPHQADTAGVVAVYPEDIHLYGTSFSGAIPRVDIAVQGEYSLKDGQPLQIDDVEVLLAALGLPSQLSPLAGSLVGNQLLPGWQRYTVSQASLGFTRVFGPRKKLFDSFTLTGELAGTHIHGMPAESTLRLDAPGTYLPGDAAVALAGLLPRQDGGYPTATSWGYRVAAQATYNDVLKYFTLEPTLRFEHDVRGITPGPISNFVEGRQQASLGLIFGRTDSWNTELGYTRYLGGGAQNLLGDRDFVGLSLAVPF